MSKATQSETQQYKQLQQQNTPPKPLLRNVFWAFVVGGIISVIGQAVFSFFVSRGLSEELAPAPTAGVMVFLGAFLTGLGIYDELGRFAGMGSALPITGFANSIVSPAMEFKREGWVLGLGARMFAIAGPVIVFAVVTSWIVGLLHFVANGGGG